ncbi:Sterol desaturase/sphingolipid hydroxylase, fatty acid hydroxylase superfamily [Yoonia tamlensis]|uniref:Sterol desaturase/sphingolipid hydroxylase, fatty acid hydroxylase superfamily n=1 Tax=Yoonia tamlensis TaxID=390270 RepID=A0A1I6G757_9RHOB|nr:sterol desaturase family protein [Yoonia tamlensis]SFR38033.1 Sterol desaturase/sphingolipid hydroxylase, fatty acid hydroxylase superfamily [Yoonia tamlensis]
MTDAIWHFFARVFDGYTLVTPHYLASFIVIAWVVYRWRAVRGGFADWLFPAAIWRHASTRIDLVLFAVGKLVTLLGISARFAATPLVAAAVVAQIDIAPLRATPMHPVWLAFYLWLLSDFATYWSHRAHHSVALIWPLHAVHHSASVLTPLTAYRQHPLGSLVSTSIQTVIVGVILGLLVGAFDPDAPLSTIAGANAFVVVVNMTVANFHHSHIWISFGPVFERVLISPAQHQVHHSTNPAHFNKNYGQTIALWDWLFGTLYITGADEHITVGLDEKADAPLMTHRLVPILLDPLRRMARAAIWRN